MVCDDEGRSVDLLASQSQVDPLPDRLADHGIAERGLRPTEKPPQCALVGIAMTRYRLHARGNRTTVIYIR